jgi:hypothetical protein
MARAYTVGQHVVFGARQPSPDSAAARQLLAHELAHVVQQSRDGPTPGLVPSASHEVDARVAATAVAAGPPAVRIASGTGIGLARQAQEEIAPRDRGRGKRPQTDCGAICWGSGDTCYVKFAANTAYGLQLYAAYPHLSASHSFPALWRSHEA